MMESKELRIGNYVAGGVLHTGIGYDCYEISELYAKSAFFKQSSVGEYYKDLKPIPLTKDWLLKFGFEDWGDNIYYKDWGSLRIFINLDTYRIRIGHENYFYDAVQWNMAYPYLHELQNLYFALTGEELTLTPAAGKNK